MLAAAAAAPHAVPPPPPAEGAPIECEVSAVVVVEGGQAVQVAEGAQHDVVGLLLAVGSQHDAEMLRDGGAFVLEATDACGSGGAPR